MIHVLSTELLDKVDCIWWPDTCVIHWTAGQGWLHMVTWYVCYPLNCWARLTAWWQVVHMEQSHP